MVRISPTPTLPRRDALVSALLASSVILRPPALAADDTPLAKITNRVSIDVAIGEATPRNIVLGLFGEQAPQSTKLFENLCTGTAPGLSGVSYSNSAVYRIERDRILRGGLVAGNARKEVTRVLDDTGYVRTTYSDAAARFANSDSNGLRHDRAGLLSMPRGGGAFDFGLTLGADPSLDRDNLVVGQLLAGGDVLEALNALPTRQPSKLSELSGLAALWGLRLGVAAGVGGGVAFRLGAPGLGLGAGTIAAAGMSLVGGEPSAQPDLDYKPYTKVRLLRPTVLGAGG